MADKFKKVEKRFVISDSRVNDYGFRLLTSGYQKQEFEKNPIGYYMHNRDQGVLLRWVDLAVEGDEVVGYPCINLSNTRGQQTVDEVESGFLNASSVGFIVVLEFSNDASLRLKGQTGPTITKWYNRECSLVDVPGNGGALTTLLSAEGNEITLQDLAASPPALSTSVEGANNENFNSDHMNEVKLTLPDLAAIKAETGLDVGDAAALLTQIRSLKLKADTAIAESIQLKTDKAGLEVKIDTLKAEHTKQEVDGMLEVALKAGKITVPLKAHLATTYAGNPAGLKIDLDSRQDYTPLAGAGKPTGGGAAGPTGSQGDYEALQKLSWDDMHKSGKLPNLKANYPELYKEKYKEKYSVYPS